MYQRVFYVNHLTTFHPFRPDKIDFNSLKKEEPIKNLNMAFECAEQEFDIAPLLDAPGNTTQFLTPCQCPFSILQFPVQP